MNHQHIQIHTPSNSSQASPYKGHDLKYQQPKNHFDAWSVNSTAFLAIKDGSYSSEWIQGI